MGFLMWMAVGLVVTALFRLLGPVDRRRPWRSVAALGLVGALVGGLLATVFGFGGLMALDARAAVSAALGALAALLGSLLRYNLRS
jgi:uncharacterized membrane protein YeaQ/YmgE (transglycosylase-associated protein family)